MHGFRLSVHMDPGQNYLPPSCTQPILEGSTKCPLPCCGSVTRCCPRMSSHGVSCSPLPHTARTPQPRTCCVKGHRCHRLDGNKGRHNVWRRGWGDWTGPKTLLGVTGRRGPAPENRGRAACAPSWGGVWYPRPFPPSSWARPHPGLQSSFTPGLFPSLLSKGVRQGDGPALLPARPTHLVQNTTSPRPLSTMEGRACS